MKVDLHGLAGKITDFIPEDEPTGLRFMIGEMVRHIEGLEQENDSLRRDLSTGRRRKVIQCRSCRGFAMHLCDGDTECNCQSGEPERDD